MLLAQLRHVASPLATVPSASDPVRMSCGKNTRLLCSCIAFGLLIWLLSDCRSSRLLQSGRRALNQGSLPTASVHGRSSAFGRRTEVGANAGCENRQPRPSAGNARPHRPGHRDCRHRRLWNTGHEEGHRVRLVPITWVLDNATSRTTVMVNSLIANFDTQIPSRVRRATRRTNRCRLEKSIHMTTRWTFKVIKQSVRDCPGV